MEIILVVVTLISLAVALVMSTIAWRLIKEERQRSAARVEALTAEVASFETDVSSETPEPALPRQPSSARPSPAVRPATFALASDDISERVTPPSRSLDTAGTTNHLFGGVDRRDGHRLRPLALTAVGVLFAVVIGVLFLSQSNAEERRTPAPVASREAGSLDLITLSHARRDAEWTITGTVRNPSASAELAGVTAIAFLFDDAGGFIGSGRAPLELTPLGAGEISPFRVTVAATGPVARYRIGFRGDDGRVLRHFDRRPMAPEQARP